MSPNPTISELIDKSRRCSVEVSNHRPIDYKILKAINCTFCSVIWIGNFNKAPEQIGPLVLAKELIAKGYTILLHLPGRNNTKESATSVLNYAKTIGIRNLLVVRGATPECNIIDKKYDFQHATDLIRFIKEQHGDYFEMCVGGYPYQHPDSKSLEEDMKYMKEKYDAGAKFIVTQAAFSYEIYRNFLENCKKNGIKMRIIPGVYVIRTYVDFCFLQRLCKVPQEDPIIRKIKKIEGSDKEIAEFGVQTSKEIVSKLLADKDFCPPHLFTMCELQSIKDFLEALKK